MTRSAGRTRPSVASASAVSPDLSARARSPSSRAMTPIEWCAVAAVWSRRPRRRAPSSALRELLDGLPVTGIDEREEEPAAGEPGEHRERQAASRLGRGFEQVTRRARARPASDAVRPARSPPSPWRAASSVASARAVTSVGEVDARPACRPAAPAPGCATASRRTTMFESPAASASALIRSACAAPSSMRCDSTRNQANRSSISMRSAVRCAAACAFDAAVRSSTAPSRSSSTIRE